MNLQDEKIKIIVTDDQPLFRTGVCNALSRQKDISIIGEAINGVDLLQKLEYLVPDIILLNIQMPVMDGLTALPLIKKKYPGIKVIILSFLNDPTIIRRMIEQGADCYITKETGSDDVYKAIVGCHRDGLFINDTMIHAFAGGKAEAIPEQPYKFNDKEIRILKLLKKGVTIKKIGAKVGLNHRTVGAIIDKLKLKTDSKSIEELTSLISKKAPQSSARSKNPIKSRIATFFSRLKIVFIILGIVTVFFIPRIIDGLTPVDVLTEKIHERSKYKFNGSVCNDNHISHSQGRGTCSWHGGVNYKFYKGEYSKSIEECREEALKRSWRD